MSARFATWIFVLRLARWLFHAEKIQVTWSEFEWDAWRHLLRASKHKVPKSRWKTYDDTVRLCGFISKAFGEPYTLESLAGFMKLAAGRLKVKSHSGEIKRSCDHRR